MGRCIYKAVDMHRGRFGICACGEQLQRLPATQVLNRYQPFPIVAAGSSCLEQAPELSRRFLMSQELPDYTFMNTPNRKLLMNNYSDLESVYIGKGGYLYSSSHWKSTVCTKTN